MREGGHIKAMCKGGCVEGACEGLCIEAMREGEHVEGARERACIEATHEGGHIEGAREGAHIEGAREGAHIEATHKGGRIEGALQEGGGGRQHCVVCQGMGERQHCVVSRRHFKARREQHFVMSQGHERGCSSIISSHPRTSCDKGTVKSITAVCINLGTRVIFSSKFSAGISISEKGNLVQLVTDTAQTLTLELYRHQHWSSRQHGHCLSPWVIYSRLQLSE